MKYIIIITLFITLCYALTFENYYIQYNKSYNLTEYTFHEKIYNNTIKMMKELQQYNIYARFSINKFTDNLQFNCLTDYNNISKTFIKSNNCIYKKKDWRKLNAVTPVKNQGSCGSCWSFSTVGNIETQYYLANNILVSLSAQELVSCDNMSNGCDGGSVIHAYEWLMSNRNGYIETNVDYPYISEDGNNYTCIINNTKTNIQICNYQIIDSNETDMEKYVYEYGPISVYIDSSSWQSYEQGILTNCTSVQLNHAAVIIGFDNTNNPPYWIIKNSWGTDWGENGYIRIEKGTNQCLITSRPSYSILC